LQGVLQTAIVQGHFLSLAITPTYERIAGAHQADRRMRWLIHGYEYYTLYNFKPDTRINRWSYLASFHALGIGYVKMVFPCLANKIKPFILIIVKRIVLRLEIGSVLSICPVNYLELM
jgi:hypothetical protein